MKLHPIKPNLRLHENVSILIDSSGFDANTVRILKNLWGGRIRKEERSLWIGRPPVGRLGLTRPLASTPPRNRLEQAAWWGIVCNLNPLRDGLISARMRWDAEQVALFDVINEWASKWGTRHIIWNWGCADCQFGIDAPRITRKDLGWSNPDDLPLFN